MYTIQKPDKAAPKIYYLTDYCDVQGEDCILYCKSTVSENKEKSPAAYNLGMVPAQEFGDESMEDYDGDEEYDDSLPDMEVIKEWSYRKMGPYVGLCRLRLLRENTGEAEDTEDLLYVSSRFSNLSVTKMLNVIQNDEEISGYIRTGKSKEKNGEDSKENWLISFDFKDTLDLTKVCYKETKYYDKIEKEYHAVSELLKSFPELYVPYDNDHKVEKNIRSENNRMDIVYPYAINMAVLFECYVRACIRKSLKDNGVSGVKLYPYVQYHKDEEKNPESKYRILEYSMDKINQDLNKINQDSNKRNIKNHNYMDSLAIPDIILEKEGKKEYFIFDAKYKKIKKSDRSDRLQILAYAYLYQTSGIGHFFPQQEEKRKFSQWEINNEGENKIKYGMFFLPMDQEISERFVEFLT